MNSCLNDIEARIGLIDLELAAGSRGSNYHFAAFVLIYTLMHNYPFRSVNTLLILRINTPAMPLNDAQIGGFFYARVSRV